MSRFPFVLLLLPLLLVGCTPDSIGPAPVDVERLALTLVDLQLAEALKSEIPAVLRDSMQTVYEDNVLADHEFTRASFDSTMWIIRKEPEWINEVFSRVNDEIARLGAEEKRTPKEVQLKN